MKVLLSSLPTALSRLHTDTTVTAHHGCFLSPVCYSMHIASLTSRWHCCTQQRRKSAGGWEPSLSNVGLFRNNIPVSLGSVFLSLMFFPPNRKSTFLGSPPARPRSPSLVGVGVRKTPPIPQGKLIVLIGMEAYQGQIALGKTGVSLRSDGNAAQLSLSLYSLSLSLINEWTQFLWNAEASPI